LGEEGENKFESSCPQVPKAQTPILRFVVELLYNLLCNKYSIYSLSRQHFGEKCSINGKRRKLQLYAECRWNTVCSLTVEYKLRTKTIYKTLFQKFISRPQSQPGQPRTFPAVA